MTVAAETSEQRQTTHKKYQRRRLVDNVEWLNHQAFGDEDNQEWLNHQPWESPELNVPYMQSEAAYAQNEDRGLRSEATRMHDTTHQPEVIFLAEMSQPLKPKAVQSLHLGQRLHMGIIYEEAGHQDGQIVVVDVQTLPRREQTSWHTKTSLNRAAQVMSATDDAAHSIAEVRKPVKPTRFVRSKTATKTSRMKLFGYNFGARPETVQRRKHKAIQEEQRKQEALAQSAIIYVPTEDGIEF